MLPLTESNSILIKLFMHLTQLSMLANQLYFIPIEISDNLHYQKKGEKKSFATVDFCTFLVLLTGKTQKMVG